ncbi:hypothetical protein GCM10011507_01950 [Edaphobacter acidisoli]|uniref:TonB C-terminal domain-containing protein n=2 Tax=Edaphobacter acidisoli TaxID=2040573 RepID=A0A916RFS4_9BACT|nr:energy transducer TonB [Edaphobacter acidisoli]GGA54309.1 hypothetical protein GCM10011507_01950 [Edaphobacter acidisoli]
MQLLADAQNTAERYAKYITEFQELCRANDVGFGSPEEFFGLPPRLARDESFREDFTSLTKSVQRREDGKLTLTNMLTIVAVAMGGKDIANAGDAGAVPASLMVVFLAGLGGWNETKPASAQEAAKSSSNGAEVNGSGGDETSTGKMADDPAADFVQRLKAGPEVDIGSLTTTLFGGPTQVKEALGRLEMNTLAMKMHLDSIDSRIERIEPHLDDLKTRPEASEVDESLTVPVPDMKPWPKPDDEAPRPEWTASAPSMKPWPAEKEQDLMWGPTAGVKGPPPRANWPVKQAEPVWREPRIQEREQEKVAARTRSLAEGAAPLRVAEMEPEYEADLPIRVPFNEYLYAEDEPKWGRRLASGLAVIVIAVVVAGGFFYRRHGWHGYNDAVETIGAAMSNSKAGVMEWVSSHEAQSSSSSTSQDVAKGAAQPAPEALQQQAASTTPATTQGVSERDLPAMAPTSAAGAQGAENQPAAAQNQLAAAHQPQTSTRPQALAQPQSSAHASTFAPVASNAGASTDRRQDTPVRSAVRPVVTVLAGSGMAPEATADTKLPRGMHSSVPVFVDMAQLSVISDPRPAYPHDALAHDIEGDVVVQANISRSGDVESAEIVSGPAGLLKPSLDAVREWQFRPYRVNGQPVEARTYVRFRYGTER